MNSKFFKQVFRKLDPKAVLEESASSGPFIPKPDVCPHCAHEGVPWKTFSICDCTDYECGSAFDCGESVTEPRGFRRSRACVVITNLQEGNNAN